MNAQLPIASSLLAIALTAGSLPAKSQSLFDELEQQTAALSGGDVFDKEFEAFERESHQELGQYIEEFEKEFAEFAKISEEETRQYMSKLGTVWDEPEVSTKTVWISYSKDLQQKNRVDFENKSITIETIEATDKKSLRKTVKSLLVKNKQEAFQEDTLAQAIENRSKEKIKNLRTDTVHAEPILIPALTGKQSVSDEDANKLVDHLISHSESKTVTDKKGRTITVATFPLEAVEVLPSNPPETVVSFKKVDVATAKKFVSAKSPSDASKSKARGVKNMARARLGKLPKAAIALQPSVKKYAGQNDLDESLVFAIIETESSFNPMAKSGVPAYGLMQIVPGSAGKDATQQLFGKPQLLSPSYLYNSENNIEVGATYLNILYYKFLKGITDSESRLYCTIAAYNTGAGNVAKAFTGKRRLSKAIPKINAKSPQEVYQHLRLNLPYEETRNYLDKVNRKMSVYRT